MAWRQHILFTGKREVDSKVVPTELNHPRLHGGRRPKNRNVVLGAAKPGGIVLSRMSLGTRTREILLRVDNMDHFLITRPAQRRSNEIQRCLLLDRRQITKPQTIAFERQPGRTVR